jgi:pimeloyl-ACP methyl ester carboxylesterase
MRRPRIARVGSVLLALALTLAGLQPRADTAASGAVETAPSPQVLQWTPCPDVPDTECASIQVPIDYARPDGPRLPLRLGRVRAADPAQSKGVLLIIPGGPGVGIRGVFSDTRALHRTDELARDWDVVTFDPRGIGESSPVRCSPDAVPPVIAPFDRPPSPAEFEAIARANAAFIQSCVDGTGELMAHLSSLDTADDIERIRQALTPNDGLVAYGGSYGSPYATAYLERHGDHVKALVLDGVVDHSGDLPTFIGRNVRAVSEAFDRFARWCAQDSTCALHGRDVDAVFAAAIAVAPAMRTVVPQRMAGGSHPELGWPMVAQLLAQVSNGDTSPLDALAGAAAGDSTDGDPWIAAGADGLYYGVLCADFGPQRDYAAFTAAAEALARQAPRFAWRFWDATSTEHGTAGAGDCIGWPLEARNPPHRLQVGVHPNVLVANPAYDPQTPLVNALAVWLQIPEARLLIADADGHQSLIFSRCAFDAQVRFLADPAAMPSTTLCPD